MILKRKYFSTSKEKEERGRMKKMRLKRALDDVGTETGIHQLYRKGKETLTGTKTLYHYTRDENLPAILKEGLDPGHDTYSLRHKKSTGEDIDHGVYLGNQSKAIPRGTAINRWKDREKKKKAGREYPEGYGDPGTMLTLKIPKKEYDQMKKRESDPMADFASSGHDYFYANNRKYREEYDSRGKVGKALMKRRINLDQRHLRDNVVLMQEKVDPKYITKIDRRWS